MSFWKLMAILFASIDFTKQVLAVHALAKCDKKPLPRDNPHDPFVLPGAV